MTIERELIDRAEQELRNLIAARAESASVEELDALVKKLEHVTRGEFFARYVKCPICGGRYSARGGLSNHVTMTHHRDLSQSERAGVEWADY